MVLPNPSSWQVYAPPTACVMALLTSVFSSRYTTLQPREQLMYVRLVIGHKYRRVLPMLIMQACPSLVS